LPNVIDVRVFPPTVQPALAEQMGPNGIVFAIIVRRPTADDPNHAVEVWCPLSELAWSNPSSHATGSIPFIQSRIAPPPVDLAALKADAVTRVVRFADQMADQITGAAPLAEKLSWASKEAAALAYEAGTASPSQLAMLTAEASRTGETIAALVAKIKTNATAYHTAAGMIAGQRRRTVALIEAISNPATVEAEIAAILATAKTEAEALLASLSTP
jgi:hypothetical protein